MANYHYVVNGQSNGPVTIEQIDDLVKSGSLAAETLIWTDGMPEWQPYSAVRGGSATSGTTVATGTALASASPIAGAMVCSVCNQSYPADQVIRYGPSLV